MFVWRGSLKFELYLHLCVVVAREGITCAKVCDLFDDF